jgi:hypothetical protein
LANVSPAVQVRLVDPSGAVAAQQEIVAGFITPGTTALLGSPSSDALVVSWGGYGQLGPELRLARLACALP